MDIRVLGPLEVRQDGLPVVLTAAKPRTLLSLLAVQPARTVSIPSLIAELWGEDPPRSVLTTLQTYIMQIRNLISSAFGPGRCNSHAKEILQHQFNGYVLNIGDGFNDVREFDRLAAIGHRALEERRYDVASDRLRDALHIWRGDAFADVDRGPQLEVEIARLDESRLSVLSCSLEADLRLGRHHRLLGDLAGLAAQNPMHERIQALYMLALYRSGRRARALEVYASLRHALQSELGLEPSQTVRSMQYSMLNADLALDHDAERRGGLDPLDRLTG